MAALGSLSDAERDAAIVVAVMLSNEEKENGDIYWFEGLELRAIVDPPR
jgi:hypothetical protein